MIYLNENDGLYYTDEAFTTLANGWDTNSNVYYVSGVATTLPENGTEIFNDVYYLNGTAIGYINTGNGLDYYDSAFTDPFQLQALWQMEAYSNRYYIDGYFTPLDMYGDGPGWSGGQPSDGWSDKGSYNGNAFYLAGTRSPFTLGALANGFYYNTFWQDGQITPGWHTVAEGAPDTNGQGGTYFAQNGATTLNSSGSGIWNGTYYIKGNNTTLPESGTGWDSGVYYLSGVETTLDSSGNGIWNNQPYWNGSKTNLDGSYFSGANLAGADFSNVTNMQDANFTGAFLTGVDLSNVTSIIGVDFINVDLTNVNFGNVTNLTGVNFSGANLTGKDFSNVTNMDYANFDGANLTGVTFPSGVSGYYGNVYFVSGQATELDSNGDGEWNGGTYIGGVLQGGGVKNGWITDTYWINDVATTLDQNGDGTWVGKLYENGSLFSGTKYSLTFVAGVAQAEQIVTVIGTSIPVAFGLNEAEEPLVELVFASITSAGETTVEQIIPTVLPTGYTVAETVLAYSIDTTATFEGTINVDFILPSNISQAVFDRVKGFHVKNSGAIEEMARVSSDFSTKRITVAITSFSDFLFLDEPQANKSVKVVGKSKFVGKVKFA